MTNNEDYSGIEIHAENASNYLPAPEGTHIARCVTFIQLGTQKQEFQGIPGKDRKKIVLGFELPEEMHIFSPEKGEQPFYIQNTYSLVLGEKSNFKIHMEGWTKGKINNQFNPLTMLGQPCQITIQHNPSTKDPARMNAKVTGLSALTKTQVCPPQISPYKVLLFQRWNQEVFDSLSDWMQKTIEASPEYKALGNPLVIGNNEGQYQKKTAPVKIDPLPFDNDEPQF